MRKLSINFIAIILCSASLQAQVYQSHFDDITVDRARLHMGLASAFSVEPASGALNIQLPLGPGIGEGGVRFSPTIYAHHAPQITWVKASTPSNRLDASSQATFSILPGSLDLKVTSHFDSDSRTFVSGFELWNGINGSFQLDKPFPQFEGPIKADQILRAYGYAQEGAGHQPHLQEQSAERLVKYATDGSLIMALPGSTILTPITTGDPKHPSKTSVESPSKVVLIKQDLAYEFTTLYDSRFAGQFGNIWFSRYRLTGIRNKFDERIQITYGGNGSSGAANQIGYVAEYFRGGHATGHKITLAVEPGGSPNSRMRIAYTTPDGPGPIFVVDFQVEVFDLVPEGVNLWNRKEVPEWCELSRRLLIHKVVNEGTNEWVSFSYVSPTFSFNGVSLVHRLLGGITWSNGRTLALEWKDYPYRKNDARPGVWQGYFTQMFSFPGGREEEKRAWTYGVSALVDKDTVTAAERRTTYDRTVPQPRWGTRNSWFFPPRFHTAITHPDGQVTLEKYVTPPLDDDGGPKSPDPANQIRTLAHLRHMPEEVRFYARGVDWQADVDRPASSSTAFRTIDFHAATFPLGQDGYPGRTMDQGAYPRITFLVTNDRDRGIEETIQRFPWDDRACAIAGMTRFLRRDGTEVYQERRSTQFLDYPHLGILARGTGETRTVTNDKAVGTGESLASPLTWRTLNRVDMNELAILSRLHGTWTCGPTGPAMESRLSYKSDSGPNGRLVSKVDLISSGLPGEAGVAAYEHDGMGRVASIQPKGMGWKYAETQDGLGRTSARTDENGQTTAYGWDDGGRLRFIRPPTGEVATMVGYESEGRSRVITRGVQGTVLRYNAFGERIREVRSTGSGTSHRKWGYDPAGRVTWETVWLPGDGEDEGWQGGGSGPRTVYEHDDRGRLVRVVNPNGEATTTSYGTGTKTITDAAGSTVFQFDHLDRLVKVTDPLGQVTTYGHDPEGRLTTVIQTDSATGASQKRTWTYNGLGWLTATVQPETGTTTFDQFTVHGKPQVTTYTGDGSGTAKVVRATFDSLGRMLTRTSDDGSIAQTFSYDAKDAGGRAASSFGMANGKQTYARDRSVEVFRAFQGVGGSLSGLDTRVWPEGAVGTGTPQVFPQTFTQDAYRNRVQATAGQSTVATGYAQALGVPTSVSRNQAEVASGSLDEAGNLVVLNYGNGVRASFQFDPDQVRLHALSYAKGTSPLVSWAFSYDGRGLLQADGEDQFKHDPLGRLAQATVHRLASNGGADSGQRVNQAFSYDAFGNRTSSVATGVLPSESLATYNLNNFAFAGPELGAMATRNRLPSTAKGVLTGATYDPQGNLTGVWKQAGSAKTAQTFTFDALGRLIQAWDGARDVTERYAYSPEGLRTLVEHFQGSTLVKRVFNLYNDAGQRVSQFEAQPSGGPTWKRDLLHLGHNPVAEVDANGLHFLHPDARGSIRLVTTAEGAVQASQKHLPFGETLDLQGSLVPAKGFAGHEQSDANGLIYMKGRFYLPMHGRFASPDPGGDQDPAGPQRWHLYAYVRNSPLLLIDPTGVGAVPWYLGGDSTLVDRSLMALYQLTVTGNPGYQVVAQATDVVSSTINAAGNKNFAMLSNLGKAAERGAGPGQLLLSHSFEVPTSIMAGEVGGTLIGRAGNFLSGTRSRATTTLFRAVDSAELASVQRTGGQLWPSPGGGLGKYFAFSPEGAAAEAHGLSKLTGESYTTLRVTFPNTSIWSSEIFPDPTRFGPVRSVTIDNAQLGMATQVQILPTNAIPK